MKTLSTELEYEIRSLWRHAPLTAEVLERKSPELVWAIGHGSADAALVALRQLVCHDMESDRTMAALAVALGFWSVVENQSVEQRLQDFGALDGHSGDSSPRRWATSGAARIAKHIANLRRPSLLISATLQQRGPLTFDLLVEPPYRFEDYLFADYQHEYDYRLSRFVVRVDDRVHLNFDQFLQYGSALSIENICIDPDEVLLIEFEWTGGIGFGVGTQGLSAEYELGITSYGQHCYVNLHQNTDQ